MDEYEKNDEISKSHRKRGNEKFCLREFQRSIIFYNKALCYAKSPSLLSILFANRAAAYLELNRYKECLENIQLAKDLGYPNDKMPKLLAREERCKEQMIIIKNTMNKNEEAVKNFFKLSHESHPTIPFIIKGIELRSSEEFGRYLITTRDLKPGDIIATEEPYLKYLEQGHVIRFERCANCLSDNNLNLIPCEECSEYMYCSEACKKERHPYHHSQQKHPVFEKQSEVVFQAVARSKKVFGNPAEYASILKERQTTTIFDFNELNEKNCLIALASLHVKNRNVFNDQESLTNSHIVRNYLLAIVNSCRIGYVVHVKGDSYSDGGWGAFLFGSLFNHSCDANIRRTPYGNKLIFFADRPIKAGEQLFLAYHTHFSYKPRETRRHMLGFDCKCQACREDWPFMLSLPYKVRNSDPSEYYLDELLENSENVPAMIKQFKKICKYLQRIWHLHPCIETAMLTGDLSALMVQIRKKRL